MSRPGTVRERVVDALAVVLCATVMILDIARTPDTELTALSAGTAVLASLPILLRRRAPVLALTVAMLLIFAVLSFAHVYVTIAGPAMICAYTLAAARGRRAAVVAAALGLPLVVLILQVYSPHGYVSWDTAKNLAFVAIPLALGVAAHDRRAYTEALVDRAESAERTREEEALRRVGEERLRIARDVHDVVAHAMVAINVQAGVGAHLLDRDPEQARSTLREIKRVSGASLDDLRSVLGLLREEGAEAAVAPVRPTQGLAGIEDLRDGLGSAGVDLDVDLDPAIGALPAAIDATGYRIVQEALTNVLRHAGPTTARVRVAHHDDLLLIEVENDRGRGPAPGGHAGAGAGSGNGLRGMRERAAAVGGSFEAGPRAEGGWRVAASLPVGAS
ncbi:sensor histidine kinase [Jiangella sp. DSM 45060]|uniref:sensor histidine kinase n=1 Tax=Jiangella sp. DSM 45060 TaxID=1798224 RepID=UPI00087A3BD3|nr:histidine kinase [Jiangella sp. DSM 45060]SDS59255.1 Signal transduction histidine kinase [Jiangella sp. DSM 45060]